MLEEPTPETRAESTAVLWFALAFVPAEKADGKSAVGLAYLAANLASVLMPGDTTMRSTADYLLRCVRRGETRRGAAEPDHSLRQERELLFKSLTRGGPPAHIAARATQFAASLLPEDKRVRTTADHADRIWQSVAAWDRSQRYLERAFYLAKTLAGTHPKNKIMADAAAVIRQIRDVESKWQMRESLGDDTSPAKDEIRYFLNPSAGTDLRSDPPTTETALETIRHPHLDRKVRAAMLDLYTAQEGGDIRKPEQAFDRLVLLLEGIARGRELAASGTDAAVRAGGLHRAGRAKKGRRAPGNRRWFPGNGNSNGPRRTA